MKDPWTQLMKNVNMTKHRQSPKMQKRPGNQARVVKIDKHYLEALFKVQGGRCYWSDYPIDPMDIFTSWALRQPQCAVPS